MVFSSLLFLWIFLPIVFIGYYIVSDKYKNIFLLFFSLLFYAWGEPVYIFLMLFSILINWSIGILLERYCKYKDIFLIIDIFINIGVLAYFKYFNYLIRIVNRCLGTELQFREIALPIGISFFTFQVMSYIIDLYRGEYCAQKSIINLALYISFFPQLIAGPIVKYKDINRQLKCRITTIEKTAEGIRRFSYGLGKKVLISNTLALCVDQIYALDYGSITGVLSWIAAIFYMMQIYYDFSGYSDMAIGLGKIFGFEFQENFLYPYLSSSIQEFWRRWHISLSTWFKEYLYIPLGGNRKGDVRTYANLTVVFFVTGLWHGASTNFVLWGMYHGFFQIVERLGFKYVLEKHKMIARVYTLLIVNFGWVLFRADNLNQAVMIFKRMLMPWRYMESNVKLQMLIGNRTILIVALAVIGCGGIQQIFKKSELVKKILFSKIEMIYCTMILILCAASLASNTYNPFIYFRF